MLSRLRAPARRLAAAGALAATAIAAAPTAECKVAQPADLGAEVEPTTLSSEARVQRALKHHFIHSRHGPGEYEEFRVFIPDENGRISALVRFGDQTEGHGGVVHGGCTAAVCDELFGWATLVRRARARAVRPHSSPSAHMIRPHCSQLCLKPAERGAYFTANLNVDYRAPVYVNTTVVVRVWVDGLEGRKLRMRARVEQADDGTLLAEASTLFIRAKWYNEWLIWAQDRLGG